MTWRERVRELKTETYTLYLAYHDPRVGWLARSVALLVVAYAFSPLDLIPDFIPLLGLLDDLVLLPLGILLARKLIPPLVMSECRVKAQDIIHQGKPVNRRAAAVIIAIWLLLAILTGFLVFRLVF